MNCGCFVVLRYCCGDQSASHSAKRLQEISVIRYLLTLEQIINPSCLYFPSTRGLDRDTLDRRRGIACGIDYEMVGFNKGFARSLPVDEISSV